MNVPAPPKASAVVPFAVCGPTDRVPVVVTLPLDETVRPAAPPVVVKVTGTLSVVVSWSVKAAEPIVATEPDLGVDWVMEMLVTVRMYCHWPWPPEPSESVPKRM